MSAYFGTKLSIISSTKTFSPCNSNSDSQLLDFTHYQVSLRVVFDMYQYSTWFHQLYLLNSAPINRNIKPNMFCPKWLTIRKLCNKQSRTSFIYQMS